MSLVAAVLATALAALLVVVQPWAGRRRYQRLVTRVAREPNARLEHYRRGIAGEWAAVGIIALIGLLADRDFESIGLRGADDPWSSWLPVLEIAVVLALSTIVVRRTAMRDVVRRQVRNFIALLPRTATERRTFAVLAITAGVCEEVIYRGFLTAYVSWLAPSLADFWLVVIVSVPFGIVHAYQGVRGIVLTGLIGAGLGSLTVTSESLLPAIVIHALIDLRILALPDLTIPDPPPAPETTEPSLQ